MSGLFTKSLWEAVGQDLRGAAGKWWDNWEPTLVGLTKDEMRDVFASLKAGDSVAAKQAVIARMSPAEWRAYRDGTTKQLRGIAARRAALLEALEDLGKRAAKTIGEAVLGAMKL